MVLHYFYLLKSELGLILIASKSVVRCQMVYGQSFLVGTHTSTVAITFCTKGRFWLMKQAMK